MDLDLSALEAGKKTAGRSSQFNPRLKPRARPVRPMSVARKPAVCMRRTPKTSSHDPMQGKDRLSVTCRGVPKQERNHRRAQNPARQLQVRADVPPQATRQMPTETQNPALSKVPCARADDQRTESAPEQQQQISDHTAVPSRVHTASAVAAEQPVKPSAQPTSRQAEQPAEPSGGAAPSPAHAHEAERTEKDGQTPVSPSHRRVDHLLSCYARHTMPVRKTCAQHPVIDTAHEWSGTLRSGSSGSQASAGARAAPTAAAAGQATFRDSCDTGRCLTSSSSSSTSVSTSCCRVR
jgi:hypothetical protein